MISDLEVTNDEAGFPIVTWTETRALGSPEGPGNARVECRITKDRTTGVLLLVSRGSVRHGSFEEGKPWEWLRGFSIQAAENLYDDKSDRLMHQHFSGKWLGSKLLWSDPAQVILAEFAGDVAMHLNCADASPVDLEHLHVVLTRFFLTNRDEFVSRLCDESFRWDVSDGRVDSYCPTRSEKARSPAGPATIGTMMANGLAGLTALAVAGFLVYLVLILIGIVRP